MMPHTRKVIECDMYNLTALVADDSTVNRTLLRALLEGVGVIVTETDNGETAKDLLSSRAFDIAILDNQMPGSTGYELVKYLRCKLQSPMPVLLYTSDPGALPNDITDFAQVTKKGNFFAVKKWVARSLPFGGRSSYNETLH